MLAMMPSQIEPTAETLAHIWLGARAHPGMSERSDIRSRASCPTEHDHAGHWDAASQLMRRGLSSRDLDLSYRSSRRDPFGRLRSAPWT